MSILRKTEREQLRSIANELEHYRVRADKLHDDLYQRWTDKSERWQDSDAGTEAEELISRIEDARDSIESVISELEAVAE